MLSWWGLSCEDRQIGLDLAWPGKRGRVIADYVMQTQQLVVLYAVSTYHVCCLTLHYEGGREITVYLVEQIAFGEVGFNVECLEDMRAVGDSFDVRVKWLGLEDDESTWEPVAITRLEDILVMFRTW
ncbi:hypothetical protein DYB32_009236 [Aphanomyces invadans]|uniref:Chromo domain-containing protein n=1 Tax=Aphanomyces invadans TaxID=157072 RepID=A0A3R6ZIV4_9STRA|nr:hypothetical protein DYB32_009236 [Aphanomyces invadans]